MDGHAWQEPIREPTKRDVKGVVVGLWEDLLVEVSRENKELTELTENPSAALWGSLRSKPLVRQH